MVLRRITVDNSVRFIPKSEQSKEKVIKPKTIKNIQILENETKIFHKTIKVSLKNFSTRLQIF